VDAGGVAERQWRVVGVTALMALFGAGVGLGLVLLAAGVRGVPFPALRPVRDAIAGPAGARRLLRAAVVIAAGLVVGLVTGWPVGALLAALAVATLPAVLTGRGTQQAAVARVEAVAAWAEMLRDTLAGAAGIEQTIAATAPVAPAPIRSSVLALAARLEHQRLSVALRAFADELADPTADLVVAALAHAAERQAGRLAEQLGALARTAREDAAMRLRVEAGRARVRTSVRVIIATTLMMAVGLAVLSRGFLDPYGTLAGQLVLAVVGGLFALATRWLVLMGRPVTPRRILSPLGARR
jgi:multisubunit Na+/H+ antiporter MnhB subunit